MAWTELHQSAAWHPKTISLGKELGVRSREAFGLITTLWLWALEHAQDGCLGHLTDREVAAAAGWHRKPSVFVLAARKVGFVDDDGRLHDWDDYAGRLIEQRVADLERKREDRDKKREERERKAAERRRTVRGKSA